jgi:phosphoadenosine phosphosulfate reductase
MSDIEKTAIERIRAASQMSLQVYQQPLVITDSGGKDSSVCVALAQAAGVPFEVLHNLTTADAPETVYFVRDEFKRLEAAGIPCSINYPVYKGQRTSMWGLIPQKLIPPTRVVRYCCSILKERGGTGRFIMTGVRWAESSKRKNNRGIYETVSSNISKKIILSSDNDDRRRLFENCTIKAKRICNPIIDWTDADIWDYIHSEHINVNPLYQKGFRRVGCIGCPMASTKGRQREFAIYPKYQEMYIRAFDRMLAERERRGKLDGTWRIGTTGLDVFHWWMEDGIIPGQMEISELSDDDR